MQGIFEDIHPQNQTLPLGRNATFTCGISLLPEGFRDLIMTVNEYSSSNDADLEQFRMKMAVLEVTPMHITLTILATEENNNTLVTCKVIAQRNYQSNVAVLFVQGRVHQKLISKHMYAWQEVNII